MVMRSPCTVPTASRWAERASTRAVAEAEEGAGPAGAVAGAGGAVGGAGWDAALAMKSGGAAMSTQAEAAARAMLANRARALEARRAGLGFTASNPRHPW